MKRDIELEATLVAKYAVVAPVFKSAAQVPGSGPLPVIERGGYNRGCRLVSGAIEIVIAARLSTERCEGQPTARPVRDLRRVPPPDGCPRRTNLGDLPNHRTHKHELFGKPERPLRRLPDDVLVPNREMDHAVPRARGGSDHVEKLHLLCGACNRAKGTATQAELIAKRKGARATTRVADRSAKSRSGAPNSAEATGRKCGTERGTGLDREQWPLTNRHITEPCAEAGTDPGDHSGRLTRIRGASGKRTFSSEINRLPRKRSTPSLCFASTVAQVTQTSPSST